MTLPRYGKHSPKMGQDCLKMWQHRPHTVSKRKRERETEKTETEKTETETGDRDRDRDRRQRERERGRAVGRVLPVRHFSFCEAESVADPRCRNQKTQCF